MSIDDLIIDAARMLQIMEQRIWPWMLCADVDLSERQVRRHMVRMADAGLFERIGRRGGYRLAKI